MRPHDLAPTTADGWQVGLDDVRAAGRIEAQEVAHRAESIDIVTADVRCGPRPGAAGGVIHARIFSYSSVCSRAVTPVLLLIVDEEEDDIGPFDGSGSLRRRSSDCRRDENEKTDAAE